MPSIVLAALLTMTIAGCQSSSTASQQARQAQRTVDNASVTAAVQAKLTGDRQSNFARVDVKADQGVVDLTGAVPSAQQRQRAERLAREVDGVTQVHNHLTVQE